MDIGGQRAIDRLIREPSGSTIGLIAAFSLVLISVIWTAVLDQARFERGEAVASAVRENVNRSLAFEEYVARTLQAADAAMHHLAEKYPEIAGTPKKPRWIDDPVVNNSLFAAVSILNERGDLVATTFNPPPRLNAADRETFRVHIARDTKRMFVGTARVSGRVGPSIGLSRRINRPDGSFAGVVVIQMSPAKLTAFAERADLRPTDLMSVIGIHDAITRARRTGTRSSYGEDLAGMLVMKRQARDPNGTYLGPGGLDGILRYFSHRRLTDYPLFVTVGVAQADILKPIETRRRKYFVAAGLLTLATIGFATLLTLGLFRRQRSADAVATANARLREAQRVGQIGDWDHDLETGRIRWSRQLYDMYERDPALGPPTFTEHLAYLDEQSRLAINRSIGLAVRTGEPQEYELRVLLPSGGVSYRQTVAVPTRDGSGKVVRLHGTDQDVSARKMLDKLQAEMAHLSRIDAMNTMAATLAHELNQPLAAATNYLAGSKRMVEEEGKLPLVREGVSAAEQQIQLAAKIIRRIRDMVANRGSCYERASLREIVDDSIALVAVANDYPEIRLRQRLAKEARHVVADRVQIQQVMINLIRNACDATEGVERPRVTISSQRSTPSHVQICVADNGNGIHSPLEELFSPFGTSKEAGLGLGLSISRTIVEAHGGRIWVESSGASGTTIAFTLPAAPEAAQEASSEHEDPPEPALS